MTYNCLEKGVVFGINEHSTIPLILSFKIVK